VVLTFSTTTSSDAAARVNNKKTVRDKIFIMLPSLYEYLKLLMTVVIFENYLEEDTEGQGCSIIGHKRKTLLSSFRS
jgi:hypothetical protein